MIHDYNREGCFKFFNPMPRLEALTISNKISIISKPYKSEPTYLKASGWYRGYGFEHFWSNCHSLLDRLADLDGMQQLCHHYYLKNGSINAIDTVERIKNFLSHH